MAVKTVKVLDGQTIWDIAIQEYGSIEAIFQLMQDNSSLSLAVPLVGGVLLKLNGIPVNKPVADYFQANHLYPVSGRSFNGGRIITGGYRRITVSGERRIMI